MRARFVEPEPWLKITRHSGFGTAATCSRRSRELLSNVLHQILDRSGFSPVTKDKYRLVIDRWIDFAGSDPKTWTRDKAQEFYDQLLDSGVSIQSANTYMASLRYVSRWYATKSGAVDFAVVQKQRGRKNTPSKSDNEESILEENEAISLLATCEEQTLVDARDLAMITIMLETGMRRMSVRGLDFEGVSNRKGYPTVKVPIKGAGGEETFTVPLSDIAYAALSSWMEMLSRNEIKSGAVFRRLSPRVDARKPFEIGHVVSLTGINEILGSRTLAAGTRHVNPHMLRHTFITWRSRAGFSPLDIAEITGHRVATVVVGGLQMKIGGMATYFHADVEKIRSSTPAWLADLVQQLLAGRSG